MRVVLFALASVAACGPPPQPQGDDAGGGAPDARGADAKPPAFDGHVYVHSYQNLYAVDPETLDVSLIGTFDWPGGAGSELMTDIAVDKDNNIVGVTFGGLWAIDHDTAHVTYLTDLSGQEFNGLSYLPVGTIDPDHETLVGTGLNGTVWTIDPTTGAETQLGAYGGQIISSGDIVSVEGFGTVATVKNGGEMDYLARIDPTNGAATIIGPTGYADIWGIGYWRNKVFGFVATNQFVLIDVDTGAATYVSTGPENWAGAGVTTKAPIVP